MFNFVFDAAHNDFYSYYDDNNCYLELCVPGVKRDSLKVSVSGKELSILANRRKSRCFTKTEFERVFVIPDDVDVERFSADLNEGILIITMPKLEKKIQKTIRVM